LKIFKATKKQHKKVLMHDILQHQITQLIW